MFTVTVTEKKKVEVKYLEAFCQVRYWEDAEVNGVEDTEGTIHGREGETWKIAIELETGKILHWPKGMTASVHYKVYDAGRYVLRDADLNEIAEIDGYVPRIMSPKENGYGDYIIMDITEDGTIQNWKVDLSAWEGDDE